MRWISHVILTLLSDTKPMRCHNKNIVRLVYAILRSLNKKEIHVAFAAIATKAGYSTFANECDYVGRHFVTQEIICFKKNVEA